MYDAMSGRRFHPAAQFTSLVSRGLMPEDASLAAEAPRFTDNPFKLGVASGEPHPDGFVLWTRLAPDPLAEDGLGGMPKRHVPVQWEVAEDEHFRKIVKRGTAAALPELAHSVHVEVHGLKPGRYYWYRFKAGGRSAGQAGQKPLLLHLPISAECRSPSLHVRLGITDILPLIGIWPKTTLMLFFSWRLYL